jgi:hypothetical protein
VENERRGNERILEISLINRQYKMGWSFNMLIDLSLVASPLFILAGIWWSINPEKAPPTGSVMLLFGVAIGVLAFVYRSHSSFWLWFS